MIVSGSTSQALSAALARELGEPLAGVDYERFPDGELLVRLADTDAERAVVVASTTTAEAHIELLQLQDAAREAGIGEVVTVLPYMGYARQDRAFAAGDPVTARAVARALSPATDRVLTVSPHEPAVCEFFEPTAEAVTAAPLLADPLPTGLDDPVFVAPDEGATDLAAGVAERYGRGEVDHFEKVRHSGTEVEITPSEVDVDGRDVVVVDDIVATGSTMSEAVGLLAADGAASVTVACVHALFARDARSKLARAGVDAIYATDTVERDVSRVSVAPALAERLE